MAKKLLSIIGFIIFLAFASISGQVGKMVGKASFSPSKLSEEEILAKQVEGFEAGAKKINDSLPRMVDEDTRMDWASVGPGALVTYHYTLPNYSSTDIDPGLMRTNLFPIVKNSVCSSKDMELSLQYGGKYKYSYSGNDGILISEFTIDRTDCGFSTKSP